MAITIELSSGRRITVEEGSATIGRGPEADVVVESVDLQPIHAKISKVAGRWMVESTGDWLLQVGDGVLGRKHWLEPNQVIRLTESGVSVVFEPTAGTTPESYSGTADADAAVLQEENTPASPQTSIPPPNVLQADPHFPTQQPAHDAAGSLPNRESHDLPIEFRGRCTVMIGMNTLTLTGKRFLGAGLPKQNSLVIDRSEVGNVLVNQQHVQISFKRNAGMPPLVFEAANAEEARLIATAMEPDDFDEMRRTRIEASRRSRAIDPSPPRVFTVVF
jgi:hypothetical protein